MLLGSYRLRRMLNLWSDASLWLCAQNILIIQIDHLWQHWISWQINWFLLTTKSPIIFRSLNVDFTASESFNIFAQSYSFATIIDHLCEFWGISHAGRVKKVVYTRAALPRVCKQLISRDWPITGALPRKSRNCVHIGWVEKSTFSTPRDIK